MAVREKADFVPGELYFITFTIHGWRNIFISDRYYRLVYRWFDYLKRDCGNKVYGYVIMPNHLHVIITISDRSPKLSQLIQSAKRVMVFSIIKLLREDGNNELLDYFAGQADARKGAKHKLFEERYDSLVIGSGKFFKEKLNYIHRNPVAEKWHLVSAPESYVHSSAANYILGRGVYEVDIMEF